MMMMMMGEGAHLNPTVHAPPWSLFDDPTDLRRYAFPVSGVSGGPNECSGYEFEAEDLDLADAPVDAYTCDEFRMYEFKVRRCARGRSHDWTECPYAHPGEKARRRDPRKFRYSGAACPEFRKGSCRRGDGCELAHGVFECWLHPERYRTQPCKDGTACRRRVCFFAHTPDQLRVLSPSPKHQASEPPESYDGSPLRRLSLDAYFPSPASPKSDSPPASPCGDALRRASWPVGGSSMSELLASVRNLQLSKELSKARSMPRSWGSPIAGMALPMSVGFGSSPATPKRLPVVSGGLGWLEGLDGGFLDEAAAVERVESGRALRAKMVERLSKENELDASGSAPDVDWVSELVM